MASSRIVKDIWPLLFSRGVFAYLRFFWGYLSQTFFFVNPWVTNQLLPPLENPSLFPPIINHSATIRHSCTTLDPPTASSGGPVAPGAWPGAAEVGVQLLQRRRRLRVARRERMAAPPQRPEGGESSDHPKEAMPHTRCHTGDPTDQWLMLVGLEVVVQLVV